MNRQPLYVFLAAIVGLFLGPIIAGGLYSEGVSMHMLSPAPNDGSVVMAVIFTIGSAVGAAITAFWATEGKR